ncbi:alkyl hydroperoxide reductase subunit F [Castellaniella sp.]|uniref:alkyl hydroperoxide reductase subunit F n=1 Tax=Castellaniella sp. TaxID=1955812 RepID=UPI00356435C8
MLDANLKAQLATYLERVTQALELRAALGDDAGSRELQAFLEEIAALSGQITLVQAEAPDGRVPSFEIARAGSDIGVRFAGIPLGHEFTSLVLALLQVGGHPPRLDDDVIEQIRALPGDYHFETFFSLSCQNCPDVVQALNAMSVINPRIRHVAIDGAHFQDEVQAREILSVPAVFLDGALFHQGRAGVEELLALLDAGDDEAKVQALNAREPFDVLVVGGGPAGAAAAVYAARKGIRTGVVAERFGGQVLDTMAIENYISILETEGPKFGVALEQHVKAYEVDIMNLQQARRLIPGQPVQVELANGAVLKAKSVILSTGARWRQINVPGEDEYRNRGVAYCPHCDGPLFKGKRTAVIGGGNSGVEAAIDLAGLVGHVTLIEFDHALRADDVLQRKLRSLPNVTILTSAQTTEIHGDGKRVTHLSYKDRNTGAMHQVDLEGVFIQIGLVPNTEWLKGVVDLSPHGEILVDARGQTSVPGVFAAGDVTTVPYKQIIIAAGEGAKAALAAFDYLIRSSVETSEAA